jgi:adenine-specific DNA-methyltransferase
MDNSIELKNILYNTLENCKDIWVEETNNKNETEKFLNYSLLIDRLENHNPELIKLLISNETLKEKFFIKIDEVLVFKLRDFIFFLQKNKVDNSYTRYKNQIGLTDSNKFLKYNNDIVLDFPFKDCILEGGQSTEEGLDNYYEWQDTTYKDKLDENGEKIKNGKKNVKEIDIEEHYKKKTAKRKEIFYNQIIAHDEIDRLLDQKALINWKRFTKDGEQIVKDGEQIVKDGTIKENLIIKGNNLLTLHSIKKRFNQKIKLIYIDPPYNTGSDGFNYNDNFNHSTWLTFMKNRLEIAKELLRDDGTIWVNIDDKECHYLKVLCDEIFGRENFVINFIWQKKYSPANDAKWFSDTHDHILVFAKNKQAFKPNLLPRSDEMNKRYSNPDNDPRGDWKSGGFSVKTYSKDYDYPIEIPSGSIVYPPKGSCWQTSKENYLKKLADNRIWFGPNGESKPQLKQFLNEVQQGVVCKSIWTYDEVGHNQISRSEIVKLFGDFVFATPKPEKLLKRIIELSTNEGDIVLDFFLGSGTTIAVAHKMKRQYIGIEQMDYVETIACERLKKVIGKLEISNDLIKSETIKDFDSSGISKSVNWQGGGEFIYFELAKWNEKAKEEIDNCQNLEELEAFFNEMYDKYFLDYNLKINEFKEKVLKDEKFRDLSLDTQKQMFKTMLDNNQMYVNKTEMADKKFGIDKKDQCLTNQFYNSEK